jgi:hypothetical protein
MKVMSRQVPPAQQSNVQTTNLDAQPSTSETSRQLEQTKEDTSRITLDNSFESLEAMTNDENLVDPRYKPDLPERELRALDERLKTINGQINITASKMQEYSDKLAKILEENNVTSKDELTGAALEAYKQNEDLYNAQRDLLIDLKDKYGTQLKQMTYYRDAILGVSTGVIAGLLSIIGALLGGKSAMGNIAASEKGDGGGIGPSPGPPGPNPPEPAKKTWFQRIKDFIISVLTKIGSFLLTQVKNATSATLKALWNLLYNTVQFLIKNVWLVIVAVAGFLAVEVSKLIKK